MDIIHNVMDIIHKRQDSEEQNHSKTLKQKSSNAIAYRNTIRQKQTNSVKENRFILQKDSIQTITATKLPTVMAENQARLFLIAELL